MYLTLVISMPDVCNTVSSSKPERVIWQAFHEASTVESHVAEETMLTRDLRALQRRLLGAILTSFDSVPSSDYCEYNVCIDL